MRGKTKFDFVNTTETNIIFHVFEDPVTFHEFLIFLCHLDFQVSHLFIFPVMTVLVFLFALNSGIVALQCFINLEVGVDMYTPIDLSFFGLFEFITFIP